MKLLINTTPDTDDVAEDSPSVVKLEGDFAGFREYSAETDPLSLTKDQHYRMQVHHCEGYGKDYFSVGFKYLRTDTAYHPAKVTQKLRVALHQEVKRHQWKMCLQVDEDNTVPVEFQFSVEGAIVDWGVGGPYFKYPNSTEVEKMYSAEWN